MKLKMQNIALVIKGKEEKKAQTLKQASDDNKREDPLQVFRTTPAKARNSIKDSSSLSEPVSRAHLPGDLPD